MGALDVHRVNAISSRAAGIFATNAGDGTEVGTFDRRDYKCRPASADFCCPIHFVAVGIELRRIEMAMRIEKDYFFFHGAVVKPRLFQACIPPRYHLSLCAG